ncbi:TlpA family protein disulfide reductase [Rossellomorea aquimaris]|uniref:TlpA family protein disulfide reductase n=1 Tax=Rossellomorea aquimaris TaxID=189382 RepID=UPI0037C8778C
MFETVNFQHILSIVLLIYGMVLLWITRKIQFIYSRNKGMFDIRIGDVLPGKIVKQFNGNGDFEGDQEDLLFVLLIETDCSVCKQLLQGIGEVKDKLPSQKILMINGNESADDEFIEELIDQNRLPISYIKNQKIFKGLNIKSVPQILIIDRAYKVMYRDVLPNAERLMGIIRDFSRLNVKENGTI